MKVSEIPYERYTLETYKANVEKVVCDLKAAKSGADVVSAYEAYKAVALEYSTQSSLAYCRFTLNTRDEFYNAEMTYYDENGPLCEECDLAFAKAITATPYRADAEKVINPRAFQMFENQLKSFSEAVSADCQEENAIVTEYTKFMGELAFTFEGETMPLSVLRGKLQDKDRDVRRRVAEAIGKTLGEHSETLDSIYDRLVKVRDRIAKKLGYKNFVELGYYRMQRIDYNAEMVAKFRENVKNDLVPLIAKAKKAIAEKQDFGQIMFYDDTISIDGEIPHPILDTKGIFEEAQKMYDEMEPSVGDFMRRMLAAEAFDVEARDGKFGGGYCTEFAKYKQPFILANFNGSYDDIGTITHEFGHALAADTVFKYTDPLLPMGLETCECHSMSMEFLTWKYMEPFFGELTDKYRYMHLMDSLSFIPYGVIVDEFQHIVYENPEMTPAERDEAYLALEKKYRPYLSFEGIPYLEKGTRWQYQMHIYESPFYYIDYCLAQTVALGFLCKSLKDYDGALKDYLHFLRDSGKKPFGTLVKEAGIAYPFEDGALKSIAEEGLKVVSELEKKL